MSRVFRILSQSAPACKHTSVNKANKARGRVAFKDIGNALGRCADRTMSSDSSVIVYFACLSGRSYVSSCG